MSTIIKPIITEKITALTEKSGRYGFMVLKSANKLEIKDAVEKAYGVTVKEVNTIIRPAKMRSRYTKSGIINGSNPSYKKAIVTLAKGETIDLYSNI